MIAWLLGQLNAEFVDDGVALAIGELRKRN